MLMSMFRRFRGTQMTKDQQRALDRYAEECFPTTNGITKLSKYLSEYWPHEKGNSTVDTAIRLLEEYRLKADTNGGGS